MKLGIAYTVFNGTEMLQANVESVSQFADELIVCWQKTSNRGHEMDYADWENIISAVDTVDDLIEFTPTTGENTKQNERNKHQLMIDTLAEKGCTHFLLLACDEFYTPEDFRKGIEIAQTCDVTYSGMFTYYKHPTWQLDPPEDYYKPFICKIYPETKLTPFDNYPVKVDPSVRVFPARSFKELPFKMHHYSMIRQDIKSKFANAASSVNWSEEQVKRFIAEYENYDLDENPGIEYFRGRKIKVVPNYFGL